MLGYLHFRMEIQSRMKAREQMKTYLSSIASLLFVVLGCIQPLLGAVAPDYTVAANPVAVQLHVGGTATSEISSSSDNGFYGSVQGVRSHGNCASCRAENLGSCMGAG